MLNNQSKLKYNLKGKAKEVFSPERVPSRSKLDKRYRIVNSVKKINPNKHNDFNIDSNSERKIINSFSPNKINDKEDKMPYIPDIERQKPESNFINLIKNLMNKRNNNKNLIYKDIFSNYQKEIPYKPRGYNYYEYIRENPIIINDDDNNLYSKIINDLQKNSEIKKNNNYNNEISYKNLNNLINNNYNYNLKVSSNEEIFNPNIKNYKYLNTLNYNIDNLEDNNKSEKIYHKTIDNDDLLKKNQILPVINTKNTKLINNNKKKDYKQSDIFFLNNSLSKEKSSEKYLFKRNYAAQQLENVKKTNINEVDWPQKRNKNKSRIGCSSVAFNLISPSLKNLSPMKKDIDLLNKNNCEKAPLISENVDKFKPRVINLRQEFLDKLNENKNAFHKKNYCAAYCDLHHEYKNLVNNVF